MKFKDLEIGTYYELSKQISSEEVFEFAKVSGDYNPIHIDEEYAKNSPFKERIVHGMLIGSLFSKIIASELPGPGSIYLEQTMSFLKPIFHNSNIKIIIEVDNLKSEKKIVYLKTTCWVSDTKVIDGTAVVKCMELN